MKKLLTLIAAIALVCSAANAQKWQSERGYRGFADAECGFESNIFYAGVSTTHGYQLIPSYLFLGGGVHISSWEGNMFYIPVFADARVQFPTGKFSALIESRIGYSFIASNDLNAGGIGGFHFSQWGGVTVTLSRKIGLDIALGLSVSYPSLYGAGLRVGIRRFYLQVQN